MRNTKRNIAMAAVTLAILGMVFVATSATQEPQVQTAQREASAPAPALETWYTPAQYVNAAALGGPIQSPVHEFY